MVWELHAVPPHSDRDLGYPVIITVTLRWRSNCKVRELYWQQVLRSPVVNTLVLNMFRHGRPHIGANGVSWPHEKMDEKLKSENMQKRPVFWMEGGVGVKWYEWWLVGQADNDYNYVYVIFWAQSGQASVENGAMLTTYSFRYTSACTIS